MIIKFEVHLASDRRMGLVHAAAAPLKAAYFNKDENRWEVSVDCLERLIEIANETDTPLKLLFNTPVASALGTDLPVLEILDEETNE